MAKALRKFKPGTRVKDRFLPETSNEVSTGTFRRWNSTDKLAEVEWDLGEGACAEGWRSGRVTNIHASQLEVIEDDEQG